MNLDFTMLPTRYFTLLLSLWVVATISACGSRQPPQPAVVDDANLERTSRSASMAFSKGAYEEAADLYRQTLEHAYARDDREVIVDTQYNLAVSLLRLNALAEARSIVDDAKSELSWTDQPIPAPLQLLDATLLFHTGQTAAAWDMSGDILANATESEVVARVHFLRGLIAAERGDKAQLRTSVAALETTTDPALDADRADLRGRLEMAEQNWAAAAAAFDAAATRYRERLDYPNMVRSLALAGESLGRIGRMQEAAVFFFRAGRSASRLDMEEQAMEWLTQARQLAQQTGQARMVRSILAHLITLKAQAVNLSNK